MRFYKYSSSILVFIFICSWFLFPQTQIREKLKSRELGLIVLYGNFCQIPASLTMQVFNFSKCKQRKSRENQKKSRNLNFLFFIIPISLGGLGFLFIVVFLNKIFLKSFLGMKNKLITDFSIYLFYIRKFLINIFVSSRVGDFGSKNFLYVFQPREKIFSRFFLFYRKI